MQTYNRILVAVDGSDSSMWAVRTAAGLAKSMGAGLTILHVIPVSEEAYSSGYPRTTSAEKKARESAEGYVSLAREAAEEFGANSRSLIIENLESPASGIATYASENGVDLIVIGTRDLGGFKRFLLGSVSTGVVNRALCSVLVVRNGGGPLEEIEARKKREGERIVPAVSVEAGKEGIGPKAAIAEATDSAGGGSADHAARNDADSMVGGT